MFGITAGQLRHQIDIQARGVTVDAYGQQTTSWASVGLTWAKVEPYQAKEQLQADQYQESVSHRVTIRHRALFDDPQTAAAHRIIFKGRKFNITGCTNLEERSRWTVLECAEGRSDG